MGVLMKKILINKNLVFILLIFLFSLFASSKLFTNKFYTSHDGEGHVIRMIEFDQAFKDGQVPVRLAKKINYGLGYPFFNFNYPFIYYLGEGFHLLGLSEVASFKTLMVISVILGGLSLYFLTLAFFGKIGAFVSALFFIFAPYKFLNMYVRGNVAESVGLSLIPLLLFSLDYFIKGGKLKNIFLVAVLSILILSHNITAIIGVSLAIFYFIFKIINLKNKRKIIKDFIILLFLSLLLTTFFWLPVLTEARLTKISELTTDYKDFFPNFGELIYSPWGFGAYKQGEFPGKMSPQIGLVHQLMFVVALIILGFKFIKKTRLLEKDKILLFFVGLSFLSFFLSLSFSKFLWDNFYPLQLVQIPWRFVGYLTLGFSIAAGYFISELPLSQKPKVIIVFLLILLVIYANRNHIRVNQYVDFQNPFLKNQIYGPSTTSKDEHMPKLAPRIFEIPNQNGDIIPITSGTSKRTVWKSNYHQFLVNLKFDGEFRDNTSYFPGWVAQVDGKETKINYKKDEFVRLRIGVPKGQHKLEFFFKDQGLGLFADVVSLVTFLVLIFLTIKKCFLKSIL